MSRSKHDPSSINTSLVDTFWVKLFEPVILFEVLPSFLGEEFQAIFCIRKKFIFWQMFGDDGETNTRFFVGEAVDFFEVCFPFAAGFDHTAKFHVILGGDFLRLFAHLNLLSSAR